jgi:hypothetical protein
MAGIAVISAVPFTDLRKHHSLWYYNSASANPVKKKYIMVDMVEIAGTR